MSGCTCLCRSTSCSRKKTDEHLAHLRRRHQGFKVQQLQEGPPDEGHSTSPAGVHNLLQDREYPPLGIHCPESFFRLAFATEPLPVAPSTFVVVPRGALVSTPLSTVIGNQKLGAIPHYELELPPAVRFLIRLRSTLR